jgi:hypothetical protein
MIPDVLERFRQAMRGALVTLLSGWTIVFCSVGQTMTRPGYRGDLDVFLEPNDPQGVCSVTIGLRNISGARQGEARLRLAWFDSTGTLVADQSLRMDPLDIDRYDAKNLALPVICSKVGRMRVQSAKWVLGWETLDGPVVTIEAVERTEWQMRWDGEIGLFVGDPVPG